MAESTDAPENQDRFCSVCGGRLIRSNKVGICRSTPECRRARTRAFRAIKPRQRVPDDLRQRKAAVRKPAGSPRQKQVVNLGDTFGKWTVLENCDRTGERVLCRCECDTERRVIMYTLVAGTSKSCGCWGIKQDEVAAGARVYMKAGEAYERLTVLEDVAYSTDRANCRCSCGNLKDVKAINLRSGTVRSCGCLRRELRTVHGMSSDPLYKAWYAMVERCTNPRNASWEHYGGRGIAVCERWLGSPGGLYSFIADVGQRPEGTSLDRIDNNGNYEPGNVRWATAAQQGENKRKVSDLTRQIEVLQAQVARLEARRSRTASAVAAQEVLF